MNIPNLISVDKKEFNFEHMIRRYKNGTIFFDYNAQILDDKKIGFAVEKILIGHRTFMDALMTSNGYIAITDKQDELYSILEFISNNVKISSDIIPDFDGKFFDELPFFYQNKILSSVVYASMFFATEENKSWLRKYMNYELTDAKIEEFKNK